VQDEVQRRRYLAGALLAICVAAHFGYFFESPTRTTADSQRYLDLAASLRSRHAFVAHDRIAYAVPPGAFAEGPLVPETIRTPLYPLFLAICAGITTAVFLQHVIVIAFALILFDVVAREFSVAAGFVAALIFGLMPQMIVAANVVMTEALTGVFVTTSILLLLRRRAIAAGIVMGLAILCHPIALYLPLVLLVTLFRRAKRMAITFFLCAALFPSAWAARNHHFTGRAVVSSIDGETLLLYRAAGTLAVEHHFAVFALQEQFGFYGPALHLRVPLVKRALAHSTAANHAQRSRDFMRLAFSILLRHPVEYAELAVSALIALFIDNISSLAAEGGENFMGARLHYIPLSLLLDALAIGGIVVLWRRKRTQAILIGTALGYFSVVAAGPDVEQRFLVPLLGVYAMAAGAGMMMFTGTSD